LNSVQLPFKSLARTSAQERNAQYQPGGEHIAFISNRSGQDQIWLWHAQREQAHQLSTELSQGLINNVSWSPDGKRLAWTANGKLAILDLQGNQVNVTADKLINSVLAWHQENQLLVLVDDPVPGGMYLLNLDDNKLTPYGINYVESAWVHQGYLYYSDLDGDVFVRNFHRRVDEKIAENKPLPQLNGKAMFIQGEFIYSVDQTDFMLNQYGSQGQLVKAMMQLKPTAWKVTGLKGNKLLLSQFIAIDHDIVMIE